MVIDSIDACPVARVSIHTQATQCHAALTNQLARCISILVDSVHTLIS
jgi:hypothetical protein